MLYEVITEDQSGRCPQWSKSVFSRLFLEGLRNLLLLLAGFFLDALHPVLVIFAFEGGPQPAADIIHQGFHALRKFPALSWSHDQQAWFVLVLEVIHITKIVGYLQLFGLLIQDPPDQEIFPCPRLAESEDVVTAFLHADTEASYNFV